MRIVWILACVAGLTACATQPPHPAIETAPAFCETSMVSVAADFPTGAMESCKVLSETEFEIRIRPEDDDINPSPWYSMKLAPKQSGNVTLTMDYASYKHRYSPKISTDKETWTPLPEASLSVAEDKHSASVTVTLGQDPLYLAGQEIIDNDDYLIWETKLAQAEDINLSTIARSAQNRPIRMLSTDAPSARKTVILVGRQHPPEVTGALAMRSFVDTVLSDTDLARKFRSRYRLVILPNLNPDGVELGYWRHNTGGLDLNRDWGPFTQPETQAVRNLLDTPEFTEKPPTLFLDFHSTFRNVFYTQPQEDEPTSYDFTGNWLARSEARLPDYDFERAERHQTDSPTSKNYIFGRYAIPAITYELADETDRDLIRRSAEVFAEEMMKLLIENADGSASP